MKPIVALPRLAHLLLSTTRTARGAASALLAALVLAGCASGPTSTVTVAPPLASSYAPLLTYPDRLQAVGDSGAQRWIDRSVDFRKYDAILIERIRVKLNSDSSSVDPSDLKMLTDYFRTSIGNAMQPAYKMTDKPGPGVLRVRITLVDLFATKPEMSVVILATPYATLPDLVSGATTGGPVGSAPYLGRTGIAVEFIDGGSNAVVAEYVDLAFGRKYAASTNKGATQAISSGITNYVDAYSTWAYAKQAFDDWSAQFRAALDGLRAPS